MSDRAVVLAGGKGARLRPYTVALPKPLMPLGDYPILEVIVRQLARHGFSHITLAVNHQADIIKAFFNDGGKWGVRIDYSLETEPLSTIAPLRLIADLPDHFLLMNGDVLTDLDFRSLFERHVAENRLFTIGATHRLHTIDYGVLETTPTNVLTGFSEKPTMRYMVCMGINVASREVLSRIPPQHKYGLDDLLLDLLQRGERVHVEPYGGYWLDIGRPDDYTQASEQFEQNKNLFLQ
jgi:NDP-sugar pyrophosphorylase family protein